MSSKARILANRRNAKSSTGPRSADGKGRVRLNARKHGLSVQIQYKATGTEVEALAVALQDKITDQKRKQVAYDLAEATFELNRFQQHKLSLLEVGDAISTSANSGEGASDAAILKMMRTLPILAKLERYERRVQSRQWRAIRHYILATDGEVEVSS